MLALTTFILFLLVYGSGYAVSFRSWYVYNRDKKGLDQYAAKESAALWAFTWPLFPLVAPVVFLIKSIYQKMVAPTPKERIQLERKRLAVERYATIQAQIECRIPLTDDDRTFQRKFEGSQELVRAWKDRTYG